MISSRLGLARPAIEVTWEFDFWNYVVAQLTSGQRIDYLVCDETQFYSAEQIDQLARIVDELQREEFDEHRIISAAFAAHADVAA